MKAKKHRVARPRSNKIIVAFKLEFLAREKVGTLSFPLPPLRSKVLRSDQILQVSKLLLAKLKVLDKAESCKTV